MLKEVNVTIEGDPKINRDVGKVFHITEMSALRFERWARRLIAAAVRAGVDVGTVDPSAGAETILVAGLQAFLRGSDEDIQPLMDEMLTCVKLQPSDPRVPPRPILETDLEEVATIIQLRMEVLQLHTGFSLAGTSQKSVLATQK